MKKKILSVLAIVCIALVSKSQDLDNFTTTLAIGDYLSITNKKVYGASDATLNKAVIDFVLLAAKTDGKQKLEWYNMNGKDGNIQKEIMGTATLINTISFDKEQFDKCKTNKDLKRMTGHITNSSLSHFASISDDTKKGSIIIVSSFSSKMEKEV